MLRIEKEIMTTVVSKKRKALAYELSSLSRAPWDAMIFGVLEYLDSLSLFNLGEAYELIHQYIHNEENVNSMLLWRHLYYFENVSWLLRSARKHGRAITRGGSSYREKVLHSMGKLNKTFLSVYGKGVNQTKMKRSVVQYKVYKAAVEPPPVLAPSERVQEGDSCYFGGCEAKDVRSAARSRKWKKNNDQDFEEEEEEEEEKEEGQKMGRQTWKKPKIKFAQRAARRRHSLSVHARSILRMR